MAGHKRMFKKERFMLLDKLKSWLQPKEEMNYEHGLPLLEGDVEALLKRYRFDVDHGFIKNIGNLTDVEVLVEYRNWLTDQRHEELGRANKINMKNGEQIIVHPSGLAWRMVARHDAIHEAEEELRLAEREQHPPRNALPNINILEHHRQYLSQYDGDGIPDLPVDVDRVRE